VSPVFEQQARPSIGGTVKQVDGIGPEATEEWKVVSPGEHIDRVDLEQPGATEDSAEGTAVGDAFGLGVVESLSGECDPTGL
jgi:hypothetical protein